MRPVRSPRVRFDRRHAWTVLPLALLIAALVGGCGSDGEDGTVTPTPTATTSTTPPGANAKSCKSDVAEVDNLRVTGSDCAAAQAVAAAWAQGSNCASPENASRFACTIRGYRCLTTATDQGTAVSCARSGRSVSFVSQRH